MTNISAVIAELMEKVEVNSPRIASLHYCLSEAAKRIAELEQKLTASEARCAVLAAENTGLMSFGDKLDEMHNDLNGEGTGIQGRAEVACQQVALEAAMEEFEAIKTPATDAFLAEVRASGVEMVIAAKKHQKGIMHTDTFAYGAAQESLRNLINELELFAAQLRQEAAQ